MAEKLKIICIVVFIQRQQQNKNNVMDERRNVFSLCRPHWERGKHIVFRIAFSSREGISLALCMSLSQ